MIDNEYFPCVIAWLHVELVDFLNFTKSCDFWSEIKKYIDGLKRDFGGVFSTRDRFSMRFKPFPAFLKFLVIS